MDGTNGILVFVLQYCILQYEHVYLGRCCRGWCGQVNKGANPSIVKKKKYYVHCYRICYQYFP